MEAEKEASTLKIDFEGVAVAKFDDIRLFDNIQRVIERRCEKQGWDKVSVEVLVKEAL